MHRREALLRVAALMGSSLSAPTLAALVTACDKKADNKQGENAKAKFSPDTERLVDEAAETILPATSTPGAKAAGVGPWIVMMMNECYPERDRAHFIAGINSLDGSAETAYKKSFLECSAAERTEVLKKVEIEAADHRKKQQEEADALKKKDPNYYAANDFSERPLGHYFHTLKELTMLGYFTSEPGSTQALDYVPVPGRYEGCIDMKPGQKAWGA
jgi:hypothetical protein